MMGWRHEHTRQYLYYECAGRRWQGTDASSGRKWSAIGNSRTRRFSAALALLLFGASLAAWPQENADRGQDSRLVPVYHAEMVWNGVATAPDGRVFVSLPLWAPARGRNWLRLTRIARCAPIPMRLGIGDPKARISHTAWARVNAVRVGPDGDLGWWTVEPLILAAPQSTAQKL